jgi:hypothetical protein
MGLIRLSRGGSLVPYWALSESISSMSQNGGMCREDIFFYVAAFVGALRLISIVLTLFATSAGFLILR